MDDAKAPHSHPAVEAEQTLAVGKFCHVLAISALLMPYSDYFVSAWHCHISVWDYLTLLQRCALSTAGSIDIIYSIWP